MPILPAGWAAGGSSCVRWAPWGLGVGGILGLVGPQLTPSSNHRTSEPSIGAGPTLGITGSLARGQFTEVTGSQQEWASPDLGPGEEKPLQRSG